MADWRAAQIAKAIFDANQHLVDVVLAAVGIKKHQRPKMQTTDLKDFVLTWKDPDAPPTPPKRRQTVDEQWAIIQLIQHAHDSMAKES